MSRQLTPGWAAAVLLDSVLGTSCSERLLLGNAPERCIVTLPELTIFRLICSNSRLPVCKSLGAQPLDKDGSCTVFTMTTNKMKKPHICRRRLIHPGNTKATMLSGSSWLFQLCARALTYGPSQTSIFLCLILGKNLNVNLLKNYLYIYIITHTYTHVTPLSVKSMYI